MEKNAIASHCQNNKLASSILKYSAERFITAYIRGEKHTLSNLTEMILLNIIFTAIIMQMAKNNINN